MESMLDEMFCQVVKEVARSLFQTIESMLEAKDVRAGRSTRSIEAAGLAGGSSAWTKAAVISA
jgi:hypothetical protein